jgi:hypothetical protein
MAKLVGKLAGDALPPDMPPEYADALKKYLAGGAATSEAIQAVVEVSKHLKSTPYDYSNESYAKHFVSGQMKAAMSDAEEGRRAGFYPNVDMKWVFSLNDSSRHAIRNYTGSAYDAMNNMLRGKTTGTPTHAAQAKAIFKSIKSCPRRSKSTTIWRGVRGDTGVGWAKDMVTRARAAKAGTGPKYIAMDGFQSCSASQQFAKDWNGWGSGNGKMLLRIETDHGMPIRGLSGINYENEILLNHADDYEVVNYEEVKGSYGVDYVIHLRHVTDGYPPATGD